MAPEALQMPNLDEMEGEERRSWIQKLPRLERAQVISALLKERKWLQKDVASFLLLPGNSYISVWLQPIRLIPEFQHMLNPTLPPEMRLIESSVALLYGLDESVQRTLYIQYQEKRDFQIHPKFQAKFFRSLLIKLFQERTSLKKKDREKESAPTQPFSVTPSLEIPVREVKEKTPTRPQKPPVFSAAIRGLSETPVPLEPAPLAASEPPTVESEPVFSPIQEHGTRSVVDDVVPLLNRRKETFLALLSSIARSARGSLSIPPFKGLRTRENSSSSELPAEVEPKPISEPNSDLVLQPETQLPPLQDPKPPTQPRIRVQARDSDPSLDRSFRMKSRMSPLEPRIQGVEEEKHVTTDRIIKNVRFYKHSQKGVGYFDIQDIDESEYIRLWKAGDLHFQKTHRSKPPHLPDISKLGKEE